MRHINLILTLTLAFFLSSSLFAQDSLMVQKKNQYKWNKGKASMVSTQNGVHGFVDENGDGFNDNAPDADGDGIPNGQDEDYTGSQAHKGNGVKGFVDADGDGINDNALDADGDGIPNGQDEDFVRLQDGSGRKNGMSRGSGSGAGTGTGDCDGSGPKGSAKGRK